MPAAAVIRRGQALSGFTGCKGSVDGLSLIHISEKDSEQVKADLRDMEISGLEEIGGLEKDETDEEAVSYTHL